MTSTKLTSTARCPAEMRNVLLHLLISAFLVIFVEGHGHLTSPRSRNFFAYEDGVDGLRQAGRPPREYCPHCLNTNTKICGSSPSKNYDDYLDSNGDRMPWISQATYVEGRTIEVESFLDTHHNGHMEIKACPLGNDSTQECFDAHNLTFVEDISDLPYEKMPKDENYPERGYYSGGQSEASGSYFKMLFELPSGLYGKKVLLQYKYITANSCSPPGYAEYFGRFNLPSTFWTVGLTDCTPPYPIDGSRNLPGHPEQFFNCAEVTIDAAAPTTSPAPTEAPTIPKPTTTGPTESPMTSAPVAPTAPTASPPTPNFNGDGCCTWNIANGCEQPENVWCQAQQSQCEGSCNGHWIVLEPQPTNAPTTSFPTTSPTTGAPTTTKSPTLSPTTRSPSITPVGGFFCSDGRGISSWDALSKMDQITEVTNSAGEPLTLAVLASGGAAGDGSYVVSESQAYGVLTSALVLANLDISDMNYDNAKEKFYGYYNGWKKMCINSSPAPCQSVGYCGGGALPCLPGWKHKGDFSAVEGTGAAPDGDEDAIVGMIIAIKALERNNDKPDWFDEVEDWADRSCTQFLASNTILSPSKSHRLLKLGSCWGGWNTDGNNPSYHAPGHYRIMRDYQAGISRDYSLPDLGDADVSWEEKWNMLIDTSYKFLETTQCPETGLVPNWALVREVDENTLVKNDGSFSGSGTPQYEFGAEASRTMWRIAFDAAAYPEESIHQSGPFLLPLYKRMVEYFDPQPSNTWEYFRQDTLMHCNNEDQSGYVRNVFGSWQWNGFMFGPVYSTLVAEIPEDDFSGKSFSQQNMVDAACDLVGDFSNQATYYSLSWQVIASLSLNGALADAGSLVRGESPPPPPSACCTIDFKNCSPTVEGFCSQSEENCTGPCDKWWLPNGPIAGCTARFEACNLDSECCSPGVCIGGQCLEPPTTGPVNSPTPSPVNPTQAPVVQPTSSPINPTQAPVNSPTPSPVNPTQAPVVQPTSSPINPTQAPVNPPTPSPVNPTQAPVVQPTSSPINPTQAPVNPTQAPVDSPTGRDNCCTWNGRTSCDDMEQPDNDWCHASQSNCEGNCNGEWIGAGIEPKTCIANYQNCMGDQSGCCSGNCVGNQWHMQCEP